jgi:tetratricopeptide (TPR) repeat protein
VQQRAKLQALSSEAVKFHQQGKLLEAEQLYAQILALQPRDFVGLHLLGVIRHQQGRNSEAAKLIGAALEVKPDDAEALCNYAYVLHALGNHPQALAHYDRALTLDPNFAFGWNNRGITLSQMGRPEDSLTSFERALAITANYAEAWNNRGIVLFNLNRPEDAILSYQRALAINANYAEAWNNRGTALRILKRFQEALASYDKALALRAGFPEALNNRAITLSDLKRFKEALALFRVILSAKADDPDVLYNCGVILRELKRPEEALEYLDKALAIRPRFVPALCNRGVALSDMDRTEEALESFDAALAISPEYPEALSNKGAALVSLGRFEDARKAYQRSFASGAAPASSYLGYSELITFTPESRELAAMKALRETCGESERMQLDFALAKACADLGDAAQSFRYLLSANALKRAQIHYHEEETLALFDRIEACFTRELIREKTESRSARSSPMPIFIIGMIRSGTTLVEQILASHPEIHGAGELRLLDALVSGVRDEAGHAYPDSIAGLDPLALAGIGTRYLAALGKLAPDAVCVTDKMPANFLFAGLIHLILPHARIIHIARDPIDTCVSCFSRLFTADQNFAYDLPELGRYYSRYERLMAHWRHVLPHGRILEVRYEDVVADVECQARRIVAHCGLDWDPRCLSFDSTRRPIRTASAVQVRKPIYRDSVGRAQAYEEFLGPLVHALGRGGRELPA